MTPGELWESFRPRAAWGSDRPRGTEFYLDLAAGLELINAADACGFATRILEELVYRDGGVRPLSFGWAPPDDLDGADWEQICAGCNESAREYIGRAKRAGADLITVYITDRAGWMREGRNVR